MIRLLLFGLFLHSGNGTEYSCSHIEYGYKTVTRCLNATSDMTICSAKIRKSSLSSVSANKSVRVYGFPNQTMTVSELTATVKSRHESEESSATNHVEMSSDFEIGIEVPMKKGESIRIQQETAKCGNLTLDLPFFHPVPYRQNAMQPAQEEECRTAKEATKNLLEELTRVNRALARKEETEKRLREKLEWMKSGETILVIGGVSNWTNSKKMYLLNWEQTRWETLPMELPFNLSLGGAAYLNGEIYVFGGDELEQKLYKLNQRMEWERLADMTPGCRFGPNLLSFDRSIWIFGRCRPLFASKLSNSVKKYIPAENSWITMPSMGTACAGSASAAFNGKLYVFGGLNIGCLNSSEYYDTQTGAWTLFADLPYHDYEFAMVSDGSGLLLLGGAVFTNRDLTSLGVRHSKSVYKINPAERNAEWRQLPSMRKSRSMFSANYLSEKLFAIGGLGEETTEVFNGTHWEYGPELPHSHFGFSSVVIPSDLAIKLSQANKH